MIFKNLTLAMIVALLYEILLKASHVIVPSLFIIPSANSVTFILSIFKAFVMLAFFIALYFEEKDDKRIKIILEAIISLFIIHTILRLPDIKEICDIRIARTISEICGFTKAILYLLLFLYIKKKIHSSKNRIVQAGAILMIMLGANILKNLVSLITWLNFVINGIIINPSSLFLRSMFVIFLLTNLSMIYFLYEYYQYKFHSEK